MSPYYKEPDYTLPKPGPLAKSCYQSHTWKVQLAFAEWKKDGWLSSRRDAEEALMNAILATNEDIHENVNNEYYDFLTQYLHLLAQNTFDVDAYLLNDPQIVFMEFLTDERNYQRFIEQDKNTAILAWLCVSGADLFAGEDGGDKRHVIGTITKRLTGNALVNPTAPKPQSVISALYGPFAWDLFSLDNNMDHVKMIKGIGVDIMQPQPQQELANLNVLLPDNISAIANFS